MIELEAERRRLKAVDTKEAKALEAERKVKRLEAEKAK